jgi:uncharacterized protein YcbX
MGDATAIVGQLWRWPVKAMDGEPMPSVRVDGRGIGGDRTHAVLGRDGEGWRALSRRDAPGLAGWRAAYPFNLGANVEPSSPPYTLVTSPQGRSYVWNDPRLRHALADDLGFQVRLRRDAGGLQRVERSILVSWGDADPRRLRANLHLDGELDLACPGRVLAFGGGVRMRVLRPCTAGGAYVRVLTGGRVAAGATVELAAA